MHISEIATTDLMAFMRESDSLRELGEVVDSGGPNKWRALREIYARQDEEIRHRWPHMVHPYRAVDWVRVFTPIESLAWNAIRCRGLPLYPQYPVGRYFVDFGDPVYRLAVECDGKQWHDQARDAARDAELRKLGWTIKRFTGRQCCLPEDHPESIDAFLESLRWETYHHRHQEDDE